MKQGYESKAAKTIVKDENFADVADVFTSQPLSLPTALKEQLTSLGYVYRWINEADFRHNNNLHASGWLPYNVNAIGDVKSMARNKVDAEGLMRRGDLILAIRPKSLNDAHVAKTREKNARLKGYTKEKAKEFREFIKGADKSAKITEGYEDNE